MKSDAVLKQDVEQALFWNPAIDARRIDVEVRDRIVTLRGSVDSWAQKLEAQKTALHVADARALVLELSVTPPESACADHELAIAITFALGWQEALRDHKIAVEVDHGCVTLDGEVDHAYQSRAAEAMVSRMIGVVGVANRIRVRGDHTVPDVGARIADALARRARRESSGISIDASDGVVTLSGTVASLADKRAVCGAAGAVRGVRQVVDRLTVA
ncbi:MULTISPECIES: BON domain-containing protein [Burkholderia cepacia complex]|uniref:BON domain-containing protein n=1 Tax=Burkholderia cepacia complex TaxID=87882 RepID=UPI00075E7888|nr:MULTISPECIES: BON domain-containing protein [Burkholderia cepacia complex]KVE22829.1 OsmY domain-containing protein [Burkholderia vietnamiensis]KVE61264.1 OsmY domain-containing protein [Burkholderia vietnamiensis]MBU9694014.1 BON domain-containing protein [Burkholderia multivorans]MCA7944251.1 BON domain-containing protein [Burkholderia vietnamiensis]MCA7983717.1 BON domain-containing protein [Burkholderia vietnamiensis]